MIKTVLMMGLAVLAAGCVDVTSTAGADGKPLYTIDCDGESGGCFDKAGDLCPGGYYLIERRSGTNAVRYTAGVIAAPHTHRSSSNAGSVCVGCCDPPRTDDQRRKFLQAAMRASFVRQLST